MLVYKYMDYIPLTGRVRNQKEWKKKPWNISWDYSHTWVEGLRQNRKTLVRLHGDTSEVKICTS